MRQQLLAQRRIVTITHGDGHQWLRGSTGLGFLAADGRGGTHDVFGSINNVLMAAVVLAQHHPRGGGRREFLVELHEVLRRTAAPAIDRLPVIPHAQQRRPLGATAYVHGRAATANLPQTGPDPRDDLRGYVLKFVDHQVRHRPQQAVAEELEVFRGVFAKQREHTVVGHHGGRLVQQVVFQGFPENAQGFEVETVRIVLGKAHLAHGGGHIQPEVLDKPGGGDKAVQQRRRTQLTLDLVVEARARGCVASQAAQKALG